MNISAPFIHRPVATTLITLAIVMAGAVGFSVLPVSPLPRVDFPTIAVGASLPGGSAEIMASTVATPLERQFGHIAGVTEMTSASSLGTTSITIQFDLSRDIDGAARDVEAAINAARSYLPANLPGNPTYRKVNPADAPIMIIGLTSDKFGPDKLYDEASTVIQQKLSQLPGVGQVTVGGGALPSVRVDVNPSQLASYGLTLANVKSVLSLQNSDMPKGQLINGGVTADILANDQISHAVDYKPLVIGYSNGSAVHLSDIAQVSDSVQNTRAAGYLNGKRAVMLIIFRQPGANIIQTNDNILAELPSIRASIPSGIDTTVVLDRTTTIRASVHDVERTLLISICLVIAVVFIFLRNGRVTMIPGVAMPAALIGTFAVMYLFGYSIDNLSLMALTIATGFVVDDAIVVMENISRHLEAGMKPMAAALKGAQEIGFTVLTISVSLVAVFIPLLFMGGIVGRLFREFAVTLSTAIMVSMIISLTTTPMMCAYLLRNEKEQQHGRLYLAGRTRFRPSPRQLSPQPELGAGASAADYDRAAADGGTQRGADHGHSEGLLPAAGHRRHHRRHAGPAGLLVSGNERIAAANRRRHQGRSGGRQCHRLHRRRRRDQHRLHLHCAEATGRAQDRCGARHRPHSAQAEPAASSLGLPAGGAGHPHRRPWQQRHVSVHAAGGQRQRPGQVGAAAAASR